MTDSQDRRVGVEGRPLSQYLPNRLPGHRAPRAPYAALMPVTMAEWSQGSWSTQQRHESC